MASCEECVRRLNECPANRHGHRDAGVVFLVGNPARESMGHLMYFTEDGRTALCIAGRRPPEDATEQLVFLKRRYPEDYDNGVE